MFFGIIIQGIPPTYLIIRFDSPLDVGSTIEEFITTLSHGFICCLSICVRLYLCVCTRTKMGLCTSKTNKIYYYIRWLLTRKAFFLTLGSTRGWDKYIFKINVLYNYENKLDRNLWIPIELQFLQIK